MRFQHDAWLSDVLGRPVFNLHDLDRTEDGTRAIRDHVRRSPGAFYVAKLASTDIPSVDMLSAAGFRVIEANVTFARSAVAVEDAVGASDVQVEDAREAWREPVLAIAASAFRYSRFHLDPAIENGAADRVKREWIRSCFDGRRGDRLFVAIERDDPVGFLAFMRVERSAGPVWVIDLIGVRSDRQGRGIGRRLIEAAAAACDHSARVIEAGTQTANVPSIRLYEQAGFKVVRTGFVMHLHAPAQH